MPLLGWNVIYLNSRAWFQLNMLINFLFSTQVFQTGISWGNSILSKVLSQLNLCSAWNKHGLEFLDSKRWNNYITLKRMGLGCLTQHCGFCKPFCLSDLSLKIQFITEKKSWNNRQSPSPVLSETFQYKIKPSFQNKSHKMAEENRKREKIVVLNACSKYITLLNSKAQLKVPGSILKSNGHKYNSLVTMF